MISLFKCAEKAIVVIYLTESTDKIISLLRYTEKAIARSIVVMYPTESTDKNGRDVGKQIVESQRCANKGKMYPQIVSNFQCEYS